MISARCMYASRAIYYSLKAMTSPDIFKEKTNKEKTRALTKQLIALHDDHHKGAVQHKSVFVTAATPTKKFTTNDLSDLIKFNTNTEIPKEISYDGRVFKEITATKEITETYGPFVKVYMNFDSKDIIAYKQNQARPDFIFSILGNDNSIIPRVMDEKAGVHMLETSSKGTLGILTYDISSGIPQNVPILGYPVTPPNLLTVDRRNLGRLQLSFENDNVAPELSDKIAKQGTYILNESEKKPLEIHENYMSFIWNKVQKNQLFKRSASIIITKQINFQELTPEEQQFHNDFYSKLENRTYNISKYGDRIQITKAAFYAFSRQDPDLLFNLTHLHKEGLLNNDFFDTISKAILKT